MVSEVDGLVVTERAVNGALLAHGDVARPDAWVGKILDILGAESQGQAPRWPAKSSGKGDGVLLVDPDAIADGFVTVNITHKGSSNFVVTSHGDDWDLLVNEIANYRGEVVLPSGAVVLEIVADGSWTITRS